ncbi:hypothetical protein, partial [Psychrobacter sp. GP33]|uniref:hypothetical protein n=1 Tax=Psychrobacter sp. GP33 TaxID=2758709 RepID=UPI0015F8BBAF
MINYLSREVVTAPRVSRRPSKISQKTTVLDTVVEATKKIIDLNDVLGGKHVHVRERIKYSREISRMNAEINKSKEYIANQLDFHKIIYDSINIKDIYSDTSKTPELDYFHVLNTHVLKEKYETHINKVKEIRDDKLDYLFSNPPFNAIAIDEILSFLRMHFSKAILNSLENNLKEAFSEDDQTININYASFLNYLYILPSKKIQKSDVAIDQDTGKIVIFYNSDENDYDSKKISLIPNEKNFTVSIISRKDGL